MSMLLKRGHTQCKTDDSNGSVLGCRPTCCKAMLSVREGAYALQCSMRCSVRQPDV